MTGGVGRIQPFGARVFILNEPPPSCIVYADVEDESLLVEECKTGARLFRAKERRHCPSDQVRLLIAEGTTCVEQDEPKVLEGRATDSPDRMLFFKA